MAITNAQIAALETITPANLLVAVNQAIAAILLGAQSYTVNGRQFVKGDLDKLRELRSQLQAEVNAADAGDSGGGIALVQFGEAQ